MTKKKEKQYFGLELHMSINTHTHPTNSQTLSRIKKKINSIVPFACVVNKGAAWSPAPAKSDV